MVCDVVAKRRLALGVEYNGAAFRGWQAQRKPAMPSVQDALEAVQSRVVGEERKDRSSPGPHT